MSTQATGKIIHSPTEDEQLIFNESDIHMVSDPTARLLRKIFFDRKITPAKYDELHKEHVKRVGMDRGMGNYHRNNIRKAIMHDKVTLQTFCFVVMSILNCQLDNFTISVIEDGGKGKKETYSLDL